MDEGREATHGSEEFRALSTNQVPRVIRSRRKVLPQSGHRQGPMSPATVTSPYRSGPRLTARVSLRSCGRIVLSTVETTSASSATITQASEVDPITRVRLAVTVTCLLE